MSGSQEAARRASRPRTTRRWSSRRAGISTGTRRSSSASSTTSPPTSWSPEERGRGRPDLGAAFALGVPVTPRGAGTGNYGQAMPLAGGIVLDLAEHERGHDDRAGPRRGASPARCSPTSTARRGAHSGAGAAAAPLDLQHGVDRRLHRRRLGRRRLDHAGAACATSAICMRLRVVTMEAEPRMLELTGDDLQKVSHAYGTNGIITEVEMPLTAAYDWVDVIVGFDDFMHAAALRRRRSAEQDGILSRRSPPIAAPVPHDYFLRHQQVHPARARRVVVLMVAPHAIDAFAGLHRRAARARSCFRSDTAASRAQGPAAGLRADLEPHHAARASGRSGDHLSAGRSTRSRTSSKVVRTMTTLFGDEVPGASRIHPLRRQDHLLRPAARPLHHARSGSTRSSASTRTMGCPIFNPHRYTLEEGGMKQTDEVQLAFKREADPQGPAQSRQDDRLGKPGLRLPLRQDVPVQGPGPGAGRCRLMRILLVYCHPDPREFHGRRARPGHGRPRQGRARIALAGSLRQRLRSRDEHAGKARLPHARSQRRARGGATRRSALVRGDRLRLPDLVVRATRHAEGLARPRLDPTRHIHDAGG